MPVSTRHSNPIGHRYHDENECYIWTSKLAMTRFLQKQGSTITSLSSVTPAITLCILHVVGTWIILQYFAPPGPRWPARLAPTTCGRERVNNMGLFSDNAEDRKTFRQQLRETNISHWHEPIHEPVEFNDSISLHIVFREMEGRRLLREFS